MIKGAGLQLYLNLAKKSNRVCESVSKKPALIKHFCLSEFNRIAGNTTAEGVHVLPYKLSHSCSTVTSKNLRITI